MKKNKEKVEKIEAPIVVSPEIDFIANYDKLRKEAIKNNHILKQLKATYAKVDKEMQQIAAKMEILFELSGKPQDYFEEAVKTFKLKTEEIINPNDKQA